MIKITIVGGRNEVESKRQILRLPLNLTPLL